MPWKPQALRGQAYAWQPSSFAPMEIAATGTVWNASAFNADDPDPRTWDAGLGSRQDWTANGLLDEANPPSINQEDDDPSHWSVFQLITALHGWVRRSSSGSSSQSRTSAWDTSILGQLKVAEMQTRVVIRYFMSDVNLELRHRPDPASRNWLSLPPRTTVFWRGQIGYDEATGQPWYLVYKIFRGDLYSGFVPASYLRPATARPIPDTSQPETDQPVFQQIPPIRDELEQLWLKILTQDERRAYYQPWFDLQFELSRLAGVKYLPMPSSRPFLLEELPPSLTGVLEDLLKPDWFVRKGPPPAFLGISGGYAISSEIQQALREIIFYVYRVRGPVSVETWEVIGRAFGIPAADAFLQVLHPTLWTAEHPATTESGLPITMSVLPSDGVYLRPRPEQIHNLEPAPFLGLPQGEQVTVMGNYHLIEGSDGRAQVLLLVDYPYSNGRTYRGWVPAEFLGTRLVSLTSETILWDGPFNTIGYGQGREPWESVGYHTFGQAQFLNLRIIFRNLGWVDWMDFPDRHLNLCGQLATMESMNVSLEEGFRVFASSSSGRLILQTADLGTSPGDLKQFIENLGWQAEIHYGSTNLEPFLSSHQVILALVASANGRVRHDGWSGHWVHILEVDDDQGLVRFYNPLFNQDQELTTTEFDAAWERTDEAGITNVDRIFVTAHP